eukprot:403366441
MEYRNQQRRNSNDSDDNELERPLLVEESYTFDDREGLKNINTQSQTSSTQPTYQSPQYSQINCGKKECNATLKYPQSAFIVICPKCTTKTATQPLSKLRCGKCNVVLLYPLSKQYVYCQCGSLNQVPK